MRSIELTNEAIGTINSDLTRRAAPPACTDSALRAAHDSNGSQPLLEPDSIIGSYFYDVAFIHACSGGYVLAEFSHSSGSCFNYWLFAADSSVWKILPITTCFRNDAPASQPVFTRAALAKLGLNPELIVRLLQKQGAHPVVG